MMFERSAIALPALFVASPRRYQLICPHARHLTMPRARRGEAQELQYCCHSSICLRRFVALVFAKFMAFMAFMAVAFAIAFLATAFPALVGTAFAAMRQWSAASRQQIRVYTSARRRVLHPA
jgi:hypothetical protein